MKLKHLGEYRMLDYSEEQENYYYRARIYDQQQSRFLSNDPAGQGANLYAYVGNNPVNRRDPSGLGPFIGQGGSLPPRMIDGHVSFSTPKSTTNTVHVVQTFGGGSIRAPGWWPDSDDVDPRDWGWNDVDNAINPGWPLTPSDSSDSGSDSDSDSTGVDIPDFEIDDEEYKDCIESQIAGIGSKFAACIVSGIGAYTVAALAVTAVGAATPTGYSQAVSAVSGAGAAIKFAIAIAGCGSGYFWNYMQEGIQTAACGIAALEWK